MALFMVAVLLVGCVSGGGGEPSLPRKDPYTASGRVVDGESKGIPGVLIYYGDTGTVVESDSDGYWVITNLTDTVVVTPIKEGLVFYPSSTTVSKETPSATFTGYRRVNIQETIDLAHDGDVIVIPPDIYHENIDFKGKSITITSVNPLDSDIVAATIIDGSQKRAPVVTFAGGETSEAALIGVTIRGGSGRYLESAYCGGGLYIRDASPIISRNVIIGNSADRGSAIFVMGSSAAPEILDNIISNNAGKGGVITYTNPNYSDNHLVVRLLNNKILDNESFAIIASSFQQLTVIGNEIRRNDGGLCYSASEPESAIVEGNIFSDQSGVAITLATSTEPRTYNSIAGFIKGNAFERNHAGAIDLGRSGKVNVVIEDNTFISNVLTANYWTQGGAAIYYGGLGPSGNLKPSIVIRGNHFQENWSTKAGALYLHMVRDIDTVIVEDNVFIGNEAEEDGGAVVINSAAESLCILRNRFENNRALRGGGIAIFSRSSPMLKENEFVSNYASEQGGAIYVGYSSSFVGENTNYFEGNLPNDVFYD